MLDNFNFDDPCRETYLLAWPKFSKTWRDGFYTDIYKRPLNAVIGSDSYRIYNKDTFETFSDKIRGTKLSIFSKSNAFLDNDPLLGTILEVPDIDDVVCLRMMDPETFVKNKGKYRMGDKSDRFLSPRIYHVTPGMIQRTIELVNAFDTVDKARQRIGDGKARPINSLLRNMQALLEHPIRYSEYSDTKKPAIFRSIKSKKSDEVGKMLIETLPLVQKVQSEINRRKQRCIERKKWLTAEIIAIWDNAKFGANSYE